MEQESLTETLEKGNVEVTEDVNCNQMKDPNQRSKEHWKGKTVFQLKLPVPSMTSRLAKTKPEPPKTELRLDTDGQIKKANDLKRSRGVPSPDTACGWKSNGFETGTDQEMGSPWAISLFKELFQAPDAETGMVQQHDSWMATPAAWIRFHHEPRRTLTFLTQVDPTTFFLVDRD